MNIGVKRMTLFTTSLRPMNQQQLHIQMMSSRVQLNAYCIQGAEEYTSTSDSKQKQKRLLELQNIWADSQQTYRQSLK